MAIEATVISRAVRVAAADNPDPQHALDEISAETTCLLSTFETCDACDCGVVLALLQAQMRRQAYVEAEWLGSTGDPDAARHQREHDFWLDVVDVMRQRLASGDVQTVRWMAADLEHRCKTHALWFGCRARGDSGEARVDTQADRTDPVFQ